MSSTRLKPQPVKSLGVPTANVLHLLGPLLKMGSDTGGTRESPLPLLLPEGGVLFFPGEVGVDSPANQHRARRPLGGRALVQACRLLVIQIDLGTIHDV